MTSFLIQASGHTRTLRARPPCLTLAIPTYNSAQCILRLLESISCQDLDDIELLVIDDASRDDTTKIVRAYLEKIPAETKRVIENLTNLGLDGNYRRCLSEAQGNYVWIIGHDDYLAKDAVSRIKRVLSSANAPSGVFVNYSLFDTASGTLVRPAWVRATNDLFNLSGNQFIDTALIGFTFISSMIHRRDLVLSLDLDTDMGSNWLPAATVLQYAHLGRLAFINAPLVTNAGNSEKRPWNENGGAIRALLKLHEIIQRNAPHYDKASVKRLEDSLFRYLRRKNISARINDYSPTPLERRGMQGLAGWKSYVLYCWPILLIPPSALRGAYKVYKTRFLNKLYWRFKRV